MKGDFTRDTFDESRQFTRVLMQQGRVQLDGDFNEQVAILLHYIQALAADLIGPHGGPADLSITQQGQEFFKVNCGFEVIATESRIDKLYEQPDEKKRLKELLKASSPQLLIGKGRYYVNGVLCENKDYIGFDSQPHYPPPDGDRENELEGNHLIYLDVWERHLTYLEMEASDGSIVSIRESALGAGGPDTATRAQVVWQMKAKKSDITQESAEDYEMFLQELGDEVRPGTGLLKAKAIRSAVTSEDPCITPPESRYRGAENQLYRVEIHKSGKANDGANSATFKWSRENGSVIFPIRETGDKNVVLETMGRDERFGLKPNDWVEIVDDNYVLQNSAESLLQIDSIDPDKNLITFKNNLPPDVGRNRAWHPLLRRWDQKLVDGAIPITKEGKTDGDWIELENGIQIQFQPPDAGQPARQYQAGDYWLIPARTATGDVEWPGPVGAPHALGPRGIKHYYAPLAIFTAEGEGTDPDYLRRQFSEIWRLEPT